MLETLSNRSWRESKTSKWFFFFIKWWVHRIYILLYGEYIFFTVHTYLLYWYIFRMPTMLVPKLSDFVMMSANMELLLFSMKTLSASKETLFLFIMMLSSQKRTLKVSRFWSMNKFFYLTNMENKKHKHAAPIFFVKKKRERERNSSVSIIVFAARKNKIKWTWTKKKINFF